MTHPDPAQAASLGELAACLRQLHVLADKPSLRTLEGRTKHARGKLPGTTLDRVPLRRSAVSEMLRGRTFPRKALLLSFAEACDVDLQADLRWGLAWERLASPDQGHESIARDDREEELEELRQQLGAVQRRAAAAEARLAEVTALHSDRRAEPGQDRGNTSSRATEAGQGPADPLAEMKLEIDKHLDDRIDRIVTARLKAALSRTPGARSPKREAKRQVADDIQPQPTATVSKPAAGSYRSPARSLPIGTPVRPDRERRDRYGKRVWSGSNDFDAPGYYASQLAEVAHALTASDLDRAERVAQSIPNGYCKAVALTDVVRELAASDPDKALHLADTISDEWYKIAALTDIARTLSTSDPQRATRLARSIPTGWRQAAALAAVAKALAATEPDHAQAIAESIPEGYVRAVALTELAKVLTASNPRHALRAAEAISGEQDRAEALATVANILNSTPPRQANQPGQARPNNLTG